MRAAFFGLSEDSPPEENSLYLKGRPGSWNGSHPRIPVPPPVQGATIPENLPDLREGLGLKGGRSRSGKNCPPEDDHSQALKSEDLTSIAVLSTQ